MPDLPRSRYGIYRGVGKRRRLRLAKAELWLLLARYAQGHADDVAGRPSCRDGRVARPFAEWPNDDPVKRLGFLYGLDGDDLDRLLVKLAQECEDRAIRGGYEDTWTEDTVD